MPRQGDVVAVDTRNSLLRVDGQAMVAAIGLDRMAVIAVRDAVFVAPMERVAEVKDLVESAQGARSAIASLTPPKVARPWGSYETIGDGPRFQVKHIIVDPGETLSLQMHFHRSEHWVVVRGSAQVTVGDEVSILQENEFDLHPRGHAAPARQSGQGPAWSWSRSSAGRISAKTISSASTINMGGPEKGRPREADRAVFRMPEHARRIEIIGDPYGTRTRVFAVRGRRPRPLDEGANAA